MVDIPIDRFALTGTLVWYMCLSVSVYVCLSVRLFTFEVPFKRLLPPLPKVGCLKFLEIQNIWGKVMQRSGLRFEDLRLKVV